MYIAFGVAVGPHRQSHPGILSFYRDSVGPYRVASGGDCHGTDAGTLRFNSMTGSLDASRSNRDVLSGRDSRARITLSSVYAMVFPPGDRASDDDRQTAAAAAGIKCSSGCGDCPAAGLLDKGDAASPGLLKFESSSRSVQCRRFEHAHVERRIPTGRKGLGLAHVAAALECADARLDAARNHRQVEFCPAAASSANDSVTQSGDIHSTPREHEGISAHRHAGR